jgi:hypothetical protein
VRDHVTVPSLPAYGSARCLNCQRVTTPMKFEGSTAPHYYCIGCAQLWVEEMGYLLHCTDPKHLSGVATRNSRVA